MTPAADLTARISGSGRYLPPCAVDNEQLYRMDTIRENFDVERARAALRGVDEAEKLSAEEVFDRWAVQVTGIRERRVLDPQTTTTEHMCAEAAGVALEDAGIAATELDLIIAATVSAAEDVPNLACTVADRLGAPHVGGFSLNAACAGFVYGLAAGWSFIRAGGARNVLVASGDALTRITNYSDPKTAVLFADGAGAVVLTAADGGGGEGILAAPTLVADYAREHLNLRGQAWSENGDARATLQMGGGPQVLRQAINAMISVAEEAVARAGLGWDDIDYVVPHQANIRITRGLEKQLALGNGRVIHTIADTGNVSASSVAMALDRVLKGEEGPLPDPTRIVLTAVGGGYTSGAAVVSWRPRKR